MKNLELLPMSEVAVETMAEQEMVADIRKTNKLVEELTKDLNIDDLLPNDLKGDTDLPMSEAIFSKMPIENVVADIKQSAKRAAEMVTNDEIEELLANC